MKVSHAVFLYGALGIPLYFLCVVVPYEVYISGLDPSRHVPGPAPGYLASVPLDGIAYFLIQTGLGWLLACSAAVTSCEPPWIRRPIPILATRTGLVLLAVWGASYVRVVRDSLGSVLE